MRFAVPFQGALVNKRIRNAVRSLALSISPEEARHLYALIHTRKKKKRRQCAFPQLSDSAQNAIFGRTCVCGTRVEEKGKKKEKKNYLGIRCVFRKVYTPFLYFWCCFFSPRRDELSPPLNLESRVPASSLRSRATSVCFDRAAGTCHWHWPIGRHVARLPSVSGGETGEPLSPSESCLTSRPERGRFFFLHFFGEAPRRCAFSFSIGARTCAQVSF